MHYFDLPHATVLLLTAWLVQGAVASATDGPHRMLRAATKRSDLYRRGVRVTKRFESQFAYTEEENGWNGRSTFVSQVKVSSQKPVMNLEEIEHFLQDVQCERGAMKLSFVDSPSARDALHSCHGEHGGLIITSHESCNEEGERAVYRVHDVSFADEEGESLALAVTPASWQEAFDHFYISFGHTTEDHLFRRHADFAKIRRKRQAADIPAVDIPADTADNVNSINIDLTSETIDKSFEANAFVAGLAAAAGIPELPIEFGCNNCSTRGQLALSQGAIEIDIGQIDLIPDFLQGGDDGKDLSDVITGGFIELAATGVGARLDLFARPTASGEFEVTLITLPVLGFVIPGIGKAGATFEPRIAFNFEISGGVQLNYGLDVALPDNSNIRLDLTSIGDSEVNGFAGATLNPLPFTVDVADIDILLGLAFRPVIPVGFEFGNNLKAEVFVSVDLPRLDALLSTDVAANCGGASNDTAASPPFNNATDVAAGDLAAIGPLALVEANISVTIDAGFSLDLPILPPPFDVIEVDANIFSVGFPLITACVDAGEAMTTMTATVPDMAAKGNASVTTIYNNGTASSSTRTAKISPTRLNLGTTPAPCMAEVTTTVYNATMTVYETIRDGEQSRGNATKTRSSASRSTSVETLRETKTKSSTSKVTGIETLTETNTKSSHTTTTSTKSSHTTTTSTKVVQSPTVPVETPLSSQPSLKSFTSKKTTAPGPATTPLAPDAANFTFATATPVVTTFGAGTSIASASGSILGGANGTSTQDDTVLFTGAAVPGAEIPVMRWGRFGWQMCVVVSSMVFGAVVLR